MKNIISCQSALALMLGLFIYGTGNAQVYTFSKDITPYNDLIDSTTTNLNGGSYWDDDYWVIPIGFDFLGHDTLTVSSNGLVSLANYNNLADEEVTFTISAFADASIGADLIDRDTNTILSPLFSPIGYELSGTTPNQILKIEWRNAGFYWDNPGNVHKTDSISFQLWLYEDSNNIEMRYGAHYFHNLNQYSGNNSFGPVIGIGSYQYDLTPATNLNQYVNSAPSIYLTGNVKTPGTSASFSTLTSTDTSTCAPVRNARFKFTRDLTVAGIRQNQGLEAKIYPNPVSGPLYLELENKADATISLYDTRGVLIYEESVTKSGYAGLIHTEDFPKGLYFLKIESGDSYLCKLISVQ
jgi:hypothetical protein